MYSSRKLEKREKRRRSFAKLRSVILLALVLVVLFGNANGLEKCQEDADCSFATLCSKGFCEGEEGDCVKCQIFRREESAKSCVKEIRNCGPCLPGTEAEDLVGGGKSIYCKPIGHLSTPVIETSVNYWVITAITAIVIVAAAGGTIWKRKYLRDFFRRQKSTSNDNPPPFNQNFNQTTGGFPEAINHVAGSSTATDYSSDGESDDSTGPSSPSNRLLPLGETVNSNANPGIYQGVEIDLSEFRRSESSISIEGSPGAQFSAISIDSYNEDEGNVGFSVVVKSVGPSNCNSKNP